MGLLVSVGTQKPAKKQKLDDSETDVEDGEKKKKSKKNRSGGKLWKLSEKAFLKTVAIKSDNE